jgi:hypothetical protein
MRAYEIAFKIVVICGFLFGAYLVISGASGGDYPSVIAGVLIVAACVVTVYKRWRQA